MFTLLWQCHHQILLVYILSLGGPSDFWLHCNHKPPPPLSLSPPRNAKSIHQTKIIFWFIRLESKNNLVLWQGDLFSCLQHLIVADRQMDGQACWLLLRMVAGGFLCHTLWSAIFFYENLAFKCCSKKKRLLLLLSQLLVDLWCCLLLLLLLLLFSLCLINALHAVRRHSAPLYVYCSTTKRNNCTIKCFVGWLFVVVAIFLSFSYLAGDSSIQKRTVRFAI